MTTALQKCTACKQLKPLTAEYFYRHIKCKNGFRSECKKCINARNNVNHEKHKSRIVNPPKPVDHSKRDASVYRTYYHTACNNPVKRKMLAQFYDITVTELKKIIKTEDEKAMKLKWTDEKNTELLANASLPGATKETLAEMYGTTAHNIENRLSILRKAQTPVSDRTPLEVVDPVNTYGDVEPQQDTPVKAATINEEFEALFPIPAKPEVNKQIANLCETPDPKPIMKLEHFVPLDPKPDYTESLLETLREAEEFREPVYFACNESPKLSPVPKLRTIFDEAHRALWGLEALAKRSGIETSIITLKADERIIADASSFDGYDAVCINKKRQPTVDQTADWQKQR